MTTGGITPSPEGHDAAMIAKVDANAAAAANGESSAAPASTATERPANIPEKFWDAEKGAVRVDELAKSYVELEKVKPAAEQAAPTETLAITPDADAAKAAVGADAFAAFTAEFAEKKALSEESYKALEAKGIPKVMVDQYIAGVNALGAAGRAEGLAAAGGEEAYAKMSDWASKNMAEADLAAYNQAVEFGNTAERKQAIVALKARYEASYGSSQTGMTDGSSSASTVQGYASTAQMTADMRDPRYATDPAFRKQVQDKLGATTAF